MSVSRSPYAGASIALATLHGKERVIGRALRQGTALQACIAKAELALEAGGTGLAIASEGSFGPHPALPLLPVGMEWMVFLDRGRGLTIQEELLAPRTNFAHTRVSAAPRRARESESWRPWLRPSRPQPALQTTAWP